MKERISGVYDDLSSRNTLEMDAQLKTGLNKVEEDLLRRVPTNQKAIVQSYLDDFKNIPEGDRITGEIYQDTRSMLDRQAKAFKGSDPATHAALKSIRNQLDSAMARNLSDADAAAWQQANKEYMVMKNIEKATDATTQDLSPAKFVNALTQRDPNITKYGRGPQELSDLAKVGKQFVSESTPNSGTPLRSLAMKVLTNPVSGLTFVGGMSGGLPGAALGASANILLPKFANKLMRNPSGYLAEGLGDITQRVPGMGNLTIQELIEQLTRGAGIQTGRTVYDTSQR
jgi:hypothetical protein